MKHFLKVKDIKEIVLKEYSTTLKGGKKEWMKESLI